MNTVHASIITIGDELLIGQTIDTNSVFIAQELNKIGVWVKRRVAVGDVWNDIWQALDEENIHSEIIIITGGLGPTSDDITKQLLTIYFDGKPVINEDVLTHIKYLFEKVYSKPQAGMLERNLKQAEVPDTCLVLHNAIGTAPGMWFETSPYQNSETKKDASQDFKKRIFISLPGVPIEMKKLMTDEVIPRLQRKISSPFIIHKTAFTFGMGESLIAEKIKDFETTLPTHIRLAYLPGYGTVKLRLTSITGSEDAEKEINSYFNQLKELTKEILVTDQDEGLEITVGKILAQQNKTIATAESCTGGYIAHLITSVPGSSQYFKGSIISYANEVKENMLNVPHETLLTHGAVSQKTVEQMAANILKKLNVDYALATSGIMGPDGGSEEKPAGTVWIAVANNEKIQTLKLNLRFDRKRNIEQTAITALNLIREFILETSS